MRARPAGQVLCALLACLAGPAAAQRAEPVIVPPAVDLAAQGGVVVLDTDRLFAESLFGQALATDLQAETEALIEENRRIEAELTAEEQSLTRRRPGMEPAAFREEAEAFDARVQEIRRERDAKERALQLEATAGRERFLAAIAAVDAEIGNGSDLPVPEAAQPDAAPTAVPAQDR